MSSGQTSWMDGNAHWNFDPNTTIMGGAWFEGNYSLQNSFWNDAAGGSGGFGATTYYGLDGYNYLQSLLNQTFDFSQFDFTKYGLNDFNPEEPVSFFGKEDNAVFHQVYEQMHNLFKGTKGDGVFRVYSHGNFGTLFNGEERIRDAKTFDTVMNSKNSNWKNVDKMKDPILILFACLSGVSTTANEAIGKQISKTHPNLTVIAFNGFVTYDTTSNGIKNINIGQDKRDGNGVIVFYKNGEYLTGYRYNQFLQKYPDFK